MNYLQHLVTRRMTILGLLLGACIVSLAMQPVPASAHNKTAPATEGVYHWSGDFTEQLGNRSFGIWTDGSWDQTLLVKPLSANRGSQTLSAKKKDGDATAAICAYLYSVATYPYTNSFIKAYAISLYNSYGCQPAL